MTCACSVAIYIALTLMSIKLTNAKVSIMFYARVGVHKPKILDKNYVSACCKVN